MHVLIEALSARMGGGAITRLVGIVDALPRVAPQHRYSIVLSPSYQQAIIDRMPSSVSVVPVAATSGNLAWRAWFQSVRLPSIGRAIGANVVFAASEGAYFRAPLPVVMMCGNLLLFRTERDRDGGIYAALRRPFLLRSFDVASKVAFVSCTIRDVALAQTRLALEKTFVLYHGVDRRFSPRQAESGGAYYLAVSSIADHKGYETLLEAYARLPPSVPPLRIAGGILDRRTHQRMLEIIRSGRLETRIELLGEVPFEDLAELYRGARALLFASEVESFGLPLIEAMASGVPVIASELPICREICRAAAVYFSSGSADMLAARIVELEADESLRARMAAAGPVEARRFSWEDAARLLVAELDSVIDHGVKRN